MEFKDILQKRRSIRHFQGKPVPLNILKEIIEDSTLAPNAGNEQPWKFIVVNNRDVLKRISDESKKNIRERISKNPDDYAKKYLGLLQNESFNVFYNAPCLILILGPSNRRNLEVDSASAANYLMMSATSKGLGTCWINLGKEIKDPELIDELGIPADCTIVAPIILGFPEEIPTTPKRRKPEILKIIP